MSIILKDDGIYKLYIKGADSVINDRLSSKINQPYYNEAVKNLSIFSKDGLRTLLIGMKILSEQEINQFLNKKEKMANAEDREK